ncbi:glycerophosphodiester phosphodiesterase [Propionibacteriaceae bacterium Y1923]|uniref:glycerophosphodiester phosphodiesterase n=1 Tax=Aestuariimicrobium sp. Y1814 TaxID=3418742 RepID=UPI003C2678B2
MRAADFEYFDTRFAAMAHRGGARLATNIGRENTLLAFRNAVDLGYRYLETDVHVTRDGGLVAFHDDSLDRVTDRQGPIADLPLFEVRQAKVGGEPIPTLDEVLAAFPEARVNIDIKARGAEEPLAHVLRRHDAEHRVCIGSFNEFRLRRFRRLTRREVATSTGPLGVVAGVVGSRLGLGPAPFGAAFQVPVRTRVAGRMVEVVTREFIERAHAWGKAVHVWTIDDEATMNQLIDWGVDGLISDRIDVLRQVCLARGLWA